MKNPKEDILSETYDEMIMNLPTESRDCKISMNLLQTAATQLSR